MNLRRLRLRRGAGSESRSMPSSSVSALPTSEHIEASDKASISSSSSSSATNRANYLVNLKEQRLMLLV